MHLSSNVLSRLAAHGGLLVAALVGVVSPAAIAAEPAAPSVVLDADEMVDDRSQAEWAEAYLQWVAAFARSNSPVSDTSGALCAQKQQGNVWFLATSDGVVPAVVRDCVVPLGKTLFVPIASTLERSGSATPDCEALARVAANTLSQHLSQMMLTIDGRPVDDLFGHRLGTGDCFALDLRQALRSTARTAVADGFYVMLRPLAAGPHTIVVGARFDSTTMSTTYRLDVR